MWVVGCGPFAWEPTPKAGSLMTHNPPGRRPARARRQAYQQTAHEPHPTTLRAEVSELHAKWVADTCDGAVDAEASLKPAPRLVLAAHVNFHVIRSSGVYTLSLTQPNNYDGWTQPSRTRARTLSVIESGPAICALPVEQVREIVHTKVRCRPPVPRVGFERVGGSAWPSPTATCEPMGATDGPMEATTRSALSGLPAPSCSSPWPATRNRSLWK